MKFFSALLCSLIFVFPFWGPVVGIAATLVFWALTPDY